MLGNKCRTESVKCQISTGLLGEQESSSLTLKMAARFIFPTWGQRKTSLAEYDDEKLIIEYKAKWQRSSIKNLTECKGRCTY